MGGNWGVEEKESESQEHPFPGLELETEEPAREGPRGGHCASFPHEWVETVCPFVKVSPCPMFSLANYSLAVLPDLSTLKLVLGFSFCPDLLVQA